MKRLVSSLGALALVAVLSPAAAHAQMPEGREVTVRGTVIDLDCKFRMGQSGEGHKMCAEVCADAGLPLAILGNDGKLYMPVGGGMPGKPVIEHNKGLKQYVEQEVVVRGKAFEAGGATALMIESVRGS